MTCKTTAGCVHHYMVTMSDCVQPWTVSMVSDCIQGVRLYPWCQTVSMVSDCIHGHDGVRLYPWCQTLLERVHSVGSCQTLQEE